MQRPLEKRQFGVFRDCMYGGIEGVPLLANCRRLAKLQQTGRLTTWLSKQQNQFSGALGSTCLLIGQILNLDSAILVHIPLIWYATSTLMHQLCSINKNTFCRQFSSIVLCCHCSQSSDSGRLSNTAVRVQMRLLGLGAPPSSSAGESSKCYYVWNSMDSLVLLP